MMVLEIQEHHFLTLGARREMFALEPLRRSFMRRLWLA